MMTGFSWYVTDVLPDDECIIVSIDDVIGIKNLTIPVAHDRVIQICIINIEVFILQI